MVALATHLAQVGERPVLELRGSRLGALQQPRHLGVVSKAWCSVSRAASCSPRTSALPRGIMTAASQRNSDSAPRKACKR